MIETDHTKQFIAHSLMQLIKEMPLEKISVVQIAENCGLNRHTFYYHFMDKHDLIRWIFDRDMYKQLEMSSLNDNTSDCCTLFIRRIIDIMYDNKSFYVNAFYFSGQNSLNEHLYNFLYSFRVKQIDTILDGRFIPTEVKNAIADYFTSAIFGLIMRWANNKMPNPSDVFFTKYLHNMHIACQSMEFLIEKYIDEHI